jgi:3-methyladenine DNA glycosylase AlkD
MAQQKQVTSASGQAANVGRELDAVLAWMKKTGTKKNRDGLARYGIVAKGVFGISVAALRAQAKTLGRSHQLALALWNSGHYEARMLAVFVDEPSRCGQAQMDRWRRDFDNWAICDTACFHLFDRTPHTFGRVRAWARKKREFEKRAAYALLASLSVHDKQAPDAPFEGGLSLLEAAAATSATSSRRR